jgi:hypothetical protein
MEGSSIVPVFRDAFLLDPAIVGRNREGFDPSWDWFVEFKDETNKQLD